MIDYSKLELYTPSNAFKNVNKYSGSLSFPTSISSGATSTTTSVVSLSDTPIFSSFFANFLENNEAISLYVSGAGTTPKRWYTSSTPGAFGVGIHVSAPAAQVGWIGGAIYPIINGSTATVTGTIVNPYSVNITIDAVVVSFVFVEYTLAG